MIVLLNGEKGSTIHSGEEEKENRDKTGSDKEQRDGRISRNHLPWGSLLLLGKIPLSM